MTESEDARSAAEKKRAQRMRMLGQSMSFLNTAAKGGRKALSASLKGAMPLFEVYSGTSVRTFKQDDDAAPDGLRILDLDHGQSQVVKAASTKLFHEMLEIASVTHPVYDGAPVYAMSTDGVRPTPHLVHFIALGAAASELFDREEEKPTQPPEPEIAPPDQAVVYLSVAPGEYEVVTGPQSPSQIRRAAMRERSYNPPPMAIMASNNQPLVYSGNAVQMHAHNTQVVPLAMQRQPVAGAMPQTGVVQAANAGCGCGPQSDCGCGCGCAPNDGYSCGTCGHHTFGPPRYDADGNCAPTRKISCETQWRMRDCVKFAFCDMLRCMSEEMCDDDCHFREEFDLGDCVEVFLCSLINCLPEAICPPSKPETCCCDTRPDPGCGCNYAVGSTSDAY